MQRFQRCCIKCIKVNYGWWQDKELKLSESVFLHSSIYALYGKIEENHIDLKRVIGFPDRILKYFLPIFFFCGAKLHILPTPPHCWGFSITQSWTRTQ
jgi:hypothetical protein